MPTVPLWLAPDLSVPLEVRETGGEKNARSLIVIAFLIEIIVLYIMPFLVMAHHRVLLVEDGFLFGA